VTGYAQGLLVWERRLTDARGNPSCADVSWSAERAEAARAEAAR
jgi:hypothetical protein